MSMIKVLVKRPGEKSEVREIENDWKIFKALIGGGMLECVSIGAGIMMYLDEEGNLKGLPYNFRLGIFDIAVGDVVFFGNDGGEEEQSLTDKQIEFLRGCLALNCVPILSCR